MAACVKEAVSTLGYAPEQEKVLSEFLGGKKNVFVSLPTGFGKSL